MAITINTDLAINSDHFLGGFFEEMEQVIEGIAAGSRGAIQIADERIKGHYGYNSFFPTISSLVERRDIDAVTAGTELKATESEYISVKVNRRAQVAWTLDSFKKQLKSPDAFSVALGGELAKRKAQEMMNTGLTAGASALESQTALTNDITGAATKTLNHTALNATFAKRGDKAMEIVAVAVHSKPHYDLIGQALADKVPNNIGGMAIEEGRTPYMGRVALVTDSSGLTDANASLTDTYNVLCLVPGAIMLKNSEEEDIVFDLVTGAENLYIRMQAEWAYNIGVKGFVWDVTNGGKNPTAAAVGTATNWDQIETDDKTLLGSLLVCQ